jgi:hypothetical protein
MTSKNKLWLLRPVDELKTNDNPWVPWYDKAFGFVVRAETEEEAREMAHAAAGYENRSNADKTTEPWKDPKYSICVELLTEGPTGVMMKDFWSA